MVNGEKFVLDYMPYRYLVYNLAFSMKTVTSDYY